MPEIVDSAEPAAVLRPTEGVERRYDIDWLRVIAIGLLIVYHIVIVFQPWAILIGFVQSKTSLEALWIPMSLLNVWRIPLLFAVSGMGVCFAMRRRNWKALIKERARRILLPLVFGSLAIVPLHQFVFQRFFSMPLVYDSSVGHLWFLANIFVYVLILSPLFYYLRAHPQNLFVRGLRRLIRHPAGLLLLSIPFVVEAILVEPATFSMYAMTPHGFWIGFVAFFLGFCFVLLGDVFWESALRARFWSLALALVLFAVRLFIFELKAPLWLTAIESMTWLIAVFGLGYAYLNRPSAMLRYLSEASYPVYIVHMFFLYAASSVVLPLAMPAGLQLVVIVALSFAGCYLTYELLIRRIRVLRPLFGLKTVAVHKDTN